MIAPGPSLLEALDRLVDLDLLPEEARPTIEPLRGGVSVERVARALDALRASGASDAFAEVTQGLGRDHGAIVVAETLPEATFAEDLDIRTWRSRRYVQGWHGDLFVAPSFSPRGASVMLGSRRGAEAIAGLDRGVRAAIVELKILWDAKDDLAGLADVWLDGVKSLSWSFSSTVGSAALIRRCPALEEYLAGWCATSPEEIDALAGAEQLRSATLSDPRDKDLARIAILPRLARLTLSRPRSSPTFGVAGLSALVRAQALRELHLGCARVDDAEIVAIADMVALEELFVGAGCFGDASASRLASLRRLRVLDLQKTPVGDATARALVTLPALQELELTGTRIGPQGIRALGALRSLRKLGLSWTASDEMTAAAGATFAEGVVRWHDCYDDL